MRVGRPVTVFLTLLLSTTLPTRAAADSPPPLHTESTALLADAVRRPYGLAWTELPVTTPDGPSVRRSVSFAPAHTPAAGFVLYLAGRELDDPALRQAGVDVARGIAAAQQSTGRIPASAFFGRSAGSTLEHEYVPDRSATITGLALILTILDDQPAAERDPVLRGAALRAANWLAKQQWGTGSWVVAYPANLTAPGNLRLARLDTPDYRDATLVMILATRVLDEPHLHRSVEKAGRQLLAMRLVEPARAGRGTWTTAYTPDGLPSGKIAGYDPAVDTLATRHALQILLTTHLLANHTEARPALEHAAKVLATLRTPAQEWHRRYDLANGRSLSVPPDRDATPEEPRNTIFLPPPTTAETSPTAPFGLPPLLDALTALQLLPPEDYLPMASATLSPHHQLAATVLGLYDDPLTLALPATSADAERFLKTTDFAPLQGQPPADLAPRVRRLWLHLLHTKAAARLPKGGTTVAPAR